MEQEKRVNSWKKKSADSVYAELIIRFGEWFNHKQLCHVAKYWAAHLYKVHTFYRTNIHISMWIVTIFLTICSLCFRFASVIFLSLFLSLFPFPFHSLVRWFVSVSPALCWHCLSCTPFFLHRNSIHMIASPHRSSPIFSIMLWIVVVVVVAVGTGDGGKPPKKPRTKRTKCGIMRKWNSQSFSPYLVHQWICFAMCGCLATFLIPVKMYKYIHKPNEKKMRSIYVHGHAEVSERASHGEKSAQHVHYLFFFSSLLSSNFRTLHVHTLHVGCQVLRNRGKKNNTPKDKYK